MNSILVLTIRRLRRYAVHICLCCLVFFATGELCAEPIRAVAVKKLSAPIDQESSVTMRAYARSLFKKEIRAYLTNRYAVTIDTTITVVNQEFERVVDLCLKQAQESSQVKLDTWIFTLTIPSDSLFAIFKRHNVKSDSLALRAYAAFNRALTQQNEKSAFPHAVRTLYHCMSHIGEQLKLPEDKNTILTEYMRNWCAKFLDRCALRSDDLLITGNPGMPAEKAPEIRVMYDETPYANVTLSGAVSGGNRYFSTMSDYRGIATFSNIHIPYVSNKSVFRVFVNIGAIIDSTFFWGPRDFGIPGADNAETMLIFKIKPPKYILSYRIQQEGDTLTLPEQFKSVSFINTFLKDSCRFDSVSMDGNPDLDITIKCRFSCKTYRQQEETVIREDVIITIQELTERNRLERRQFELYTQSFNNILVSPIKFGEVYWESANKLRKALKTMLLNF